MPLLRRLSLARFAGALVFAVATLTAACAPQFRVSAYQGSNERLWSATMREYHAGRWENAVTGLEKLTLDLPARDTLLPLAHYYLGLAHGKRNEQLLAAQSFTRLAESFPDDTLADDALFQAARSYQRLWRRPDLDAQYGHQAIATYSSLVTLYPSSELKATADSEIAKLESWFARKDYENGMHYFRRKAFDSAIIYFKDVARNYPRTPQAREAQLRLVEAYRHPSMRYVEDANEVCANLRSAFPNDGEVREHCGTAPPPTSTATTP